MRRLLLLLALGAIAFSGFAANFPFSFWKSGAPTPTSTPTPPSFVDPSSISGLALWLKADSLSLSDGAAVSSWTDSSGNANTATQATGANQPVFKTAIINGKPVVRFNGTSSFFTFPTTPSANTTTTIVVGAINAAPSSITAYSPFVITSSGSSSTGTRLLTRANGTNWGSWGGADINSGEDLVSGVANILELTTTNTPSNSTIMYRNGTQKATSTSHAGGTTNGGSNYVGAEVPFSRYNNADIAELIIYNSVLSSTDRLNVERYLGTKYGITVP